MPVLTRGAVVDALHHRTALPMRSIVGTFAILDKSKLPLTPQNVLAASFTAFKTYETCVNETISFFFEKMLAGLEWLPSGISYEAFKQSELRVLAAVQFCVPSRTRVDKVETLMRELGILAELPYYHTAILALLVPGIDRIPDEMYARAVLCAATMLSPGYVPNWLARLPTETVLRDDIMRWAARIVEVAGPPEKGVKRGRDYK